jgi:hypothetical protein
MKKIFLVITCVLTMAAANSAPSQGTAAARAKNKTKSAEATIPKSVFIVPTKPEQGRDPFFPNSERSVAMKKTPAAEQGSATAALVFNGISGAQDRRFAMINGHTFAEGEEAPVNTPSGRVEVRLIELKGEIAVVEVGGHRRELRFQNH